MTNRAQHIDAFLASTQWQSASRAPLAGDASSRKYLRLGPNADGIPAVLMDADPALGNDVAPFVQITNVLRDMNLSAPKIYAADEPLGLLLIEDLGDALLARVVAADPSMESELYTAATDVLLDLHSRPQPELPPYDTELMTDRAVLAYDWYAAHSGTPASQTARAEFVQAMSDLLDGIGAPSVLIQRDYHSENLLWLPDRKGTARIGLLDYQDALLGHPAYDLVSLLKDARRDVTPATENAMIAHYIAQSDWEDANFRNAYHRLGLQRNLRILGVFARLSLHFGKAHYVDLIPRVWEFILRDLKEPANASIADILTRDLPAPTDAILKGLKDKCATIPMP